MDLTAICGRLARMSCYMKNESGGIYMDYISSNKEAWEEAFEHRCEGWGEDIIDRLKNEEVPFIEKVLSEELTNYDFSNKTIAQFCCNNGRELLAIMKLGASYGVGFDIADNMVSFANNTAKQLGVTAYLLLQIFLKLMSSFTINLITYL